VKPTSAIAMPALHNESLQSRKSAPGEDIVISGIAGYFPESENVYQLQENLFNKVNMVTQDNKRWKCGQYFS
jgi:acyl transferase domain-containing protein